MRARPDIAADGQYLKRQNTYLVTGGAGSLGKHIVEILIQRGHKVRAMDISESGLASMKYPSEVFTHICRSITNYEDVLEAARGCDIIIHTAAMKNLDITEGDVPALNLTNIRGTENVARAAIERGVECAILISTDKAVMPASAYGASKLSAEWVWRWAGRIQDKTRFITFRSGNFKQSAGNVLEVWRSQASTGQPLTITDERMERYFIDTHKAARIVCDLPEWSRNGDTAIPKMELWNMVDLMNAEFTGCSYIITGIRTGEKLSERLRTEDEVVTMENDDVMVVS